jgi:hypothetical protein
MNSQEKTQTSSLLSVTGMFIAMTLLLVSASVAFGQERSKDRDNPTPLTSNELSDDLDGSNDEYFYKFSAGPGKLTVMFEVTASGTNAGAHLDLFDMDSRSILSDVLAQGVDSGSERVVKSVQLGRRRDIVMRIKGIRYGDNGGNGVYKVRLNGAVSFTKADTPKSTPSSFAGCWNFTGKGDFAGASLGCFKQEGDRVTFDESTFEGTVVDRTLRFAPKSGATATAFAYRSGHFVMDEGGKSFTGSVNSSLNPDDNEFPVAATLVQASKKVDKDF